MFTSFVFWVQVYTNDIQVAIKLEEYNVQIFKQHNSQLSTTSKPRQNTCIRQSWINQWLLLQNFSINLHYMGLFFSKHPYLKGQFSIYRKTQSSYAIKIIISHLTIITCTLTTRRFPTSFTILQYRSGISKINCTL